MLPAFFIGFTDMAVDFVFCLSLVGMIVLLINPPLLPQFPFPIRQKSPMLTQPRKIDYRPF